jgi:hypothetical protein
VSDTKEHFGSWFVPDKVDQPIERRQLSCRQDVDTAERRGKAQRVVDMTLADSCVQKQEESSFDEPLGVERLVGEWASFAGRTLWESTF